MFRTIEISDPRFERQGLRHVTVKSAALRGRADLTVWSAADGTPEGLVILLHGVYGSHWCWALKGGAHRTAARLIATGEIPPLALAMPSDGLRGDGTGYVRHGDGTDFERWIVEDVPAATRAALPGLPDGSPMYVTGLSMGGFGALRLGGKHQARFAGISAHSAITRVSEWAGFVEEDLATYAVAADDETALDALLAAGSALPPLRFDCGKADPLLDANRALHRALTDRGVAHEYEEFEGGHEWAYWEAHIADTLRFFGKVHRAR
jgi:putative tributyrin esterase